MVEGVSNGKIFTSILLYASLALIRYATDHIPKKITQGDLTQAFRLKSHLIYVLLSIAPLHVWTISVKLLTTALSIMKFK